MTYNYHTHTYRCGHAIGTEEEYIERAIQCGVTHMGFSDHIPYDWKAEPHVNNSWNKQAHEYIQHISHLREKYQDKIEIVIGYEIEYYADYFADMLKWAVTAGVEYLILGQHFLHYGGKHTIHATESIEELKSYVLLVLDAIRSGYFTYVAHPDVFNFVGDVGLYRNEMRKICIASREMEVPLEVNFLGLREKRNYPNENFWELAGEEESPVIFGFDAHEPIHAYDGETLAKAQNLVEKYKLNYIGKPRIVFL